MQILVRMLLIRWMKPSRIQGGLRVCHGIFENQRRATLWEKERRKSIKRFRWRWVHWMGISMELITIKESIAYGLSKAITTFWYNDFQIRFHYILQKGRCKHHSTCLHSRLRYIDADVHICLEYNGVGLSVVRHL